MSIFTHLLHKNNLIFSLILILAVSLNTLVCAEDNTVFQRPLEGVPEKPQEQSYKRIIENGGEVVIDGSLRVLEPVMGKVFDMVETSTPVTPASNHARLFLRADGTKQSLILLYDDGTTTRIAGN